MISMMKKYYLQLLLGVAIGFIVFFIMHTNTLKNEIETYKDEHLQSQKQIRTQEEQITQLKREVTEQNQQLSTLNKQLLYLTAALNQTSAEKQHVEKKFEALDEEYTRVSETIASLFNEIATYQEEIEASLAWYKRNAHLDESPEQKRVKRKIDANCIEIANNYCKIKIGCFYLINSEELELHYQYDETLYEKKDKITSIDEFLKNGGGDCEDYALFFKAEYNYALSQCKTNTIILEAWKHPTAEDKKTKYWLNFQKRRYLGDVAIVEIKETIYPTIICGNLYDLRRGEIGGHCMIALTQKKIRTVDELSALDGAPIIEPQDGSFRGNINRENSEIYLLNKDHWYNESVKSWIYSVITDTDYFLYSESKAAWNSYSLFDFQLETKKQALDLVLT
ncbi:MAG: hypothetical protein QW594_00010 [Candidatus Woesearchaeota archaeon]